MFALTITIGLIDGLVRRDLRRFGAGHESGFVYHHARRMIGSSLIATGLVWLAVSQFLTPEYFGVLSSVIVGLAVSFAIGAFKNISEYIKMELKTITEQFPPLPVDELVTGINNFPQYNIAMKKNS